MSDEPVTRKDLIAALEAMEKRIDEKLEKLDLRIEKVEATLLTEFQVGTAHGVAHADAPNLVCRS
jgi:hypothetical protein